MQEADVFQTVGIAILAAESQRTQPSMRGGQWQADYRTQFTAPGIQQLSQHRKTVVRVPVRNVQGLLRVVNVPTRCLLNRQIGTGNLELCSYTQFDLAGILFENNNTEQIKPEDLFHLPTKNFPHLFRFPP